MTENFGGDPHTRVVDAERLWKDEVRITAPVAGVGPPRPADGSSSGPIQRQRG